MSPDEALAVARIRSERVMVRPDLGPCLVYLGRRNQKGYGRIGCGGREVLVHRLAEELERGPLPDGVIVMHRCDNAPCFEPGHLRRGTVSENNADMASKGRAQRRRGLDNARGRLTDEQVADIRRRRDAGEKVRAIAADLGIDHSYVSRLTRQVRRAP